MISWTLIQQIVSIGEFARQSVNYVRFLFRLNMVSIGEFARQSVNTIDGHYVMNVSIGEFARQSVNHG